MLKWDEYRTLAPLRREEFNFKFKDADVSLVDSFAGLFRWWVAGVFIEIMLFFTIVFVQTLPFLAKYIPYTAEFYSLTAQIGQAFFYFGAVLLLFILVRMIVKQVEFVAWKKKYVKKVNK